MYRIKRRRPGLKAEYGGGFAVGLASGLNSGFICAFCISGKLSLDLFEPMSLSEPALTGTLASVAFSASIFAGTVALAATEAIIRNVRPTSLLCVERLNDRPFVLAGLEA